MTKPNQIINKALLQHKIEKKLECATYRHGKFQHTDGFTEMYIANNYSRDSRGFFLLAMNKESERHSCINEAVHQKSNSTRNNIYMTTITKKSLSVQHCKGKLLRSLQEMIILWICIWAVFGTPVNGFDYFSLGR